MEDLGPKRLGLHEELPTWEAVTVTISVIGEIHRFLGGLGNLPQWLPSRDEAVARLSIA